MTEDNRIRKISAGGIVSTVAGGGSARYVDGSPALQVSLESQVLAGRS